MSQLTIKDIARLAGISHATVSRVLNHQPSVRPAMRDRVWQVIKEYNYTPQASGLTTGLALVDEGDWSHTSGYEEMQRFHQLDISPTALFSCNDLMAAEAQRAMYERALSAADYIAIVGFDDLPRTSLIIPLLTTIYQPGVEIWRHATEMFIDQLEGKDVQPAHLIFSTTLVVRQSCGALRQHSASLQKRADVARAPSLLDGES